MDLIDKEIVDKKCLHQGCCACYQTFRRRIALEHSPVFSVCLTCWRWGRFPLCKWLAGAGPRSSIILLQWNPNLRKRWAKRISVGEDCVEIISREYYVANCVKLRTFERPS